MAQWWNPFSWGTKKKEQQGAPAQFMKIVKPRETEPGKLSYEELKRRLAGIGVGYGKDFVSTTTAPYAKARREGFQRYEVPTISSAASARGLGRSTIPVSRIALSGQEAERDIEQRVAEMSLKSKEQERSEINSALTQLINMANTEADAGTKQNMLNVEEYLRQQGIRNEAISENNEAVQQAKALIATAVGATIGSVAGPAGAMAGAQIGSSLMNYGESSNDVNTIYSTIQDIFNKRGQVNIASNVGMSKIAPFRTRLGTVGG